MDTEHNSGFSNGKWNSKNITDHACPQCGRILPASYPNGEICPSCKEMNLFAEVREYIRDNDVNEFEVAIHFNIPRMKVKEWIEEGRIEYKEDGGTRFLSHGHCELCGASIPFGSLCTKCKRKVNDMQRQGFAIIKPKTDDERMRFRHGEEED